MTLFLYILLCILCTTCISFRVLMGITVNTSQLIENQLESIILNIHNDYSTNKTYEHLTVFICIYSSNGIIHNNKLKHILYTYNITHYYSDSRVPYMCAFDYPNATAYDRLIQINMAAKNIPRNLFGISEYIVHDDLSLVCCPQANIHFVQDTIAKHLNNHLLNDNEIYSNVLKLASDMKDTGNIENSSTCLAPAPLSPDVPLPTRSATSKYHTSGPCNLWWPLDRSEIYIYSDTTVDDAGSPYIHKEPVIFICPDLPASAADTPLNKPPIYVGVFEQFDITSEGILSTPSSNGVSLEGVDMKWQAVQMVLGLRIAPAVVAKRLVVSICPSTRSGPLNRHSCIATFDVEVKVVRPREVSPSAPLPSLLPMTATLGSRDLFGHALNMMGHSHGTFVEIGVNRGHYAKIMMSQWKGMRYIMVDPWEAFSASEYVDIANVADQQVHDSVMEEAILNVEQYGTRPVILRETSVAAARLMVDHTVDVVYIDGLHHYQGVMDDIAAWWPKLKQGGIMAGHDYMHEAVGETIFTVKPAVDEFARKMGLFVFQTHDSYPTWFIFKPKSSKQT